MDVLEYSGQYFTVTSQRIEMHGLFGQREGSFWVLGRSSGGASRWSKPAHFSSCVEALIYPYECYVSAIRVSANLAIPLFLEGVIRFEHFAYAYEQGDQIVISGVPFGDRLYTLLVSPEGVLSDECMPVSESEGL
jgi:hypothetical protein